MVAYARERGADEELWAVTGLVHDLDYERYPDLDDAENGHPRTALRLFAELDWPPELIDAVAGHATFLEVPRETDLAKTLFAVDELSGFVAACAFVRPTGIEGMTPKSVKKKLKQPSFAAGVNRDEVRQGAEELGVDFDQHVAFVIAAMADRADELGLAARERRGLKRRWKVLIAIVRRARRPAGRSTRSSSTARPRTRGRRSRAVRSSASPAATSRCSSRALRPPAGRRSCSCTATRARCTGGTSWRRSWRPTIA